MLFKDPAYHFQALRTMGGASIQCADIAECLQTIENIKEGDDESWYQNWLQLAERTEREALDSKQKKHCKSARSAFRRASNYYRTAEFFLQKNYDNSRLLATWRKSRDCFLYSIENQIPPVIPIKIPFEDSFLPGYLSLVDDSATPRPLLIAQTGFDGTAEETTCWIGPAATARGYNCLVFEGPGQGQVILEQKTPFRDNWETVITPVVDYALGLNCVLKDQIALMGISFGGFLVPRALVYEKRIRWGIANGGVYDYHAVCMRAMPPESEKMLDDPQVSKQIDDEIYSEMRTNALIRWGIGNGLFVFQAKTPTEWMRMTRTYRLQDLVSQISCHMLVINTEDEEQMKGQAKQLFDHLQCPKDWMFFSREEGAGAHCQIGAYCLSNERIFNWLDEQVSNIAKE